MTITDTFTRADNPFLGPDWNERGGANDRLEILNNDLAVLHDMGDADIRGQAYHLDKLCSINHYAEGVDWDTTDNTVTVPVDKGKNELYLYCRIQDPTKFPGDGVSSSYYVAFMRSTDTALTGHGRYIQYWNGVGTSTLASDTTANHVTSDTYRFTTDEEAAENLVITGGTNGPLSVEDASLVTGLYVGVRLGLLDDEGDPNIGSYTSIVTFNASVI